MEKNAFENRMKNDCGLNPQTVKDQYLGCLLGGAIGDALGAPIEFMDFEEILEKYGDRGIRDFVEHPDSQGEFTDDTQMLLFTAEGLLASDRESPAKRFGTRQIPIVYQAYLRWLQTQQFNIPDPELTKLMETGALAGTWLIRKKSMHKRRAPGNTCLSALQSGQMGSVEKPLNDSKGCGTVMRIAPVGLYYYDDMQTAFRVGVELSALTHGHPTAFLSGGFLASVISGLLQNMTLEQCITKTQEILLTWNDHQEVSEAVSKALILYSIRKGKRTTVHDIHKLGAAWIAEEALSISLFCALQSQDDFCEGVLMAVNHSGDSDSTGAITGNILGLMQGAEKIPQNWKEKLMHQDIVTEVALALLNVH